MMKKDKNTSRLKKPRVIKYTFASLAAGVVIIAPIATIVAQKPGKESLVSFVKGSYATSAAVLSPLIKEPTTKQQVTTTIDETNFSFKGANFAGTSFFTPPTSGMEHLDAYFSKNLAANSWTTSNLAGLTNGDIIYARLAVKAKDSASYEIDKNIIAVKVQGLDKALITNPAPYHTLKPAYFSYYGPEGGASIFFNFLDTTIPAAKDMFQQASPGFDYRLQFEYNLNNSGVWQTSLGGLQNGDAIQARMNVKPEFVDLYRVEPGTVSLTVSGLKPAQTGQPLDYTKLDFSGKSGEGKVNYSGYNKSEYTNLKLERTSSFLSAFSDKYIYLDHINDIYPSNGNNYKYLPTLYPVTLTHTLVIDPPGPTQIIETDTPFIMQKPSLISHASFAFNVYDGGNKYHYGSGIKSMTNYLSGVSIITKLKIDLYFNADGSFKNATKTLSDFNGNPTSGAQAITLATSSYGDGILIDSGVSTGYVKLQGGFQANPYRNALNNAFIYIDGKGNIATAMDVKDVDGSSTVYQTLVDNGMAITTSIKDVTYGDGSTWSKEIKDDLVNGEYVSAYTTGSSEKDPTSDYAKNGFALQAQNLPLTPVVVPGLDATMYGFQKSGVDIGNMFMQADQATLDHASQANFLYSTDGITFTSNLPKNLFNHDPVFVQQALKPYNPVNVLKSISLNDPVLIRVIASGIDKRILPDTIVPEDFQYAGASNKGKASLKSKTLPKPVQLQFSKTETGPYTNDSPADLKNGDSLYARLVIKSDQYYDDNYLLTEPGYKPIKLTVSGLQVQQLTDKIVANDFEFKGTHESGTVKRKDSLTPATLDPQVKIQYSVDATSTTNGTYSDVVPTTLKNGQKIYARLVVKGEFTNNYDLVPANKTPIALMVANLSPKLLNDTILSSDFNFPGQPGKGTVKLNGSKFLSNQVQVLYSLTENGNYGAAPNNLKENDQIWAQLSVKTADAKNYTLSNEAQKAVPLTVNGLGKTELKDSLLASDFSPKGSHESGTLVYAKSATLSPQVQLSYSDKPNGPFSTIAPTNLKNDDTVYIALSIIDDINNYPANYKFAGDAVTSLAYVVKGLNKKVLNDTISQSEFTYEGKHENGTVNENKTLPSQLEVQYSKTGAEPFSTDKPTDLKNGETIYAKLAVKTADANNYALDENSAKPVAITVSGLDPKELPDTLSASDFKAEGIQESGVLTNTKQLSSQAEILYGKSENGPFINVVPNDLKNGSKVYVKVGVKSTDSANYKVSDLGATAIEVTVNNLDQKELSDSLSVGDFTFSGVQESGTVATSKTPLSQLEIQYSKSASGPWSATKPTDLKTGQALYARLAVQTAYASDYKLAVSSANPVKLTVSQLLPKRLPDTIIDSDFSYVKIASGGQPRLTSKKLSPQVELQFSDSTQGPFSTTVPSGLQNGSTVYARIVVKTNDALNYDLDPKALNPIELTVSNLGKTVLPDQIAATDFNFTGTHETGSVALKPNVQISTSQVELQYSLDKGSGFSTSAPTGLKNGDTIYAKLVLKPGSELNYELDTNAGDVLTLPVQLPPKQLADKLETGDFTFSGTQESGTVNTSKSVSNEVEIQYSKEEKGTYSADIPNDLKTGETLYAKLVVLDPANYELKNGAGAPVALTVSQLEPKKLVDSISDSDFGFSGNNSFGQINLLGNKTFSPQVTLQYAIAKDGTYSTNPPAGLKNGDAVYAKLVVNPADSANYVLDENASTEVEIEVINLGKTTLPDAIKASDFIPQGVHETGTLALAKNFSSSSQVEILYASAADGNYSTNVPKALKNGDMVYVKLALKEGESADYALAPGADQPVLIKIEGLAKKMILSDILPSDFSFKGATLNSETDFGKQLASQVEVLFASSEDGIYRPVAPTYIKNGETLWVKVNVKAPYDKNYAVDSAITKPRPVLVKGLTKSTIDMKPQASDFAIARDSSAGKISVIASDPGGGVSYEYGYPGEDGKVLAWSKDAPTGVPSQEIHVRLVPNDPDNYEVSPEILVLNGNGSETEEKLTPTAYAAVTLGSILAFGLLARLALGIYRRFWKKA